MERTAADARAVAFIKRFRGPIHYAINLEGVPQHQRDDLFQEASLRILQLYRAGRIVEDAPGCLSLVITAVRNLCRNHWHRDQKHRGHVEMLEQTAAHDGLDQMEQLHRLQAHERLRACVEMLPILQRNVMRYTLKGLSNREIAEDLSIEPGHVKLLAHRARIKLRHLLTNPNLN